MMSQLEITATDEPMHSYTTKLAFFNSSKYNDWTIHYNESAALGYFSILTLDAFRDMRKVFHVE